METPLINALVTVIALQTIITAILLIKVIKGRKAYARAYNDVIRRIKKEAKRQAEIKNKK